MSRLYWSHLYSYIVVFNVKISDECSLITKTEASNNYISENMSRFVGAYDKALACLTLYFVSYWAVVQKIRNFPFSHIEILYLSNGLTAHYFAFCKSLIYP